MKRLLCITLFTFCSTIIFAQQKTFTVNGTQFIIQTKKLKNEWNTYDNVSTIYRMEKGAKKYVLKYYPFKDEGGDCNNLFWNKEKFEVSNDSITFTTHYFQKTGIDPIPEWRKQIYKVEKNGQLTSVYNKFKFYHQTDWVDN